jgi:hypothetical protein
VSTHLRWKSKARVRMSLHMKLGIQKKEQKYKQTSYYYLPPDLKTLLQLCCW